MQVNRKALFEHLASEEDDRSLKAYRALAAELKIFLHIGSLALRFSPEKAVNRSFLIESDGASWPATTRSTCSTSTCSMARAIANPPTTRPATGRCWRRPPWGLMGLSICYDLRFAYLSRALAQAGAQYLAIPAAFTYTTGSAHWHVLVRPAPSRPAATSSPPTRAARMPRASAPGAIR